jgi:hypothetical protein
LHFESSVFLLLEQQHPLVNSIQVNLQEPVFLIDLQT